MGKVDDILNDALTYIKISNNDNYKERLLEAYYLVKEHGIHSRQEYDRSNLGIGAFKYSEITIFDRLLDEDYSRSLAQFYIKSKEIRNMPKDFGDKLASYGTVGKTPYRDELIEKGYVEVDLPEVINKYNK